MSLVSLSVYQLGSSLGLGGPFVHPGSARSKLTVPWCITQAWRVMHHLLWLGVSIIWWNWQCVLTNYWVGFWVLKLGVSWAGNLRLFLWAALKMFPSVLEPVRHVDNFSSFQTIQRDWSACRWVVTTAFHLRGSFCSGLSQLTMQSHYIYFFAFCHFSVLGIAFRLGKAYPLHS